MKTRMCLLLFAALLPMLAASGARALGLQDYRFDTVHSQIIFRVEHDGFSRPAGRLHIARGWLHFDPDNWSQSSVVADIDLASANMGDKAWDDAVRSDKFLDAGKDRYAHFESTRVEKTGDGHGMLHGRLTLHGMTHAVAIPFTLNRRHMSVFGLHTIAGFSAHVTLDRFDYGMREYGDSVGHAVEVDLEIEAILDQDAPKKYRQAAQGDSHAPAR